MENLNQLTTMSDKEIQDWLRKVSASVEINVLPTALLGVNEKIKSCVYRNMSINAKTAVQKYVQQLSTANIGKSEILDSILKLENLI
ncbi:MAG: hypothetical protein JW866_04130 [Ignavibacteriales bacterium]|nr:hypothetical protein [Ignavibacteriales bacterium]